MLFEGVNLRHAKLRFTNLGSSNLQGAELQGADLSEAGLDGFDTKLNGADMTDTCLFRTDLTGVDLRQVKGLTQSQIDSARGNEQTKLPDGISRPVHWSDSRTISARSIAINLIERATEHYFRPGSLEHGYAGLSHRIRVELARILDRLDRYDVGKMEKDDEPWLADAAVLRDWDRHDPGEEEDFRKYFRKPNSNGIYSGIG